MEKFITAAETIRKLNVQHFQLLELIKTGVLQAYTEHGDLIIDADMLERKPDQTLEEILDNLKAKQRAGSGLGAFGVPVRPKPSDDQLRARADRLYRQQPLKIVKVPPGCFPVSFSELNRKKGAAVDSMSGFLFKESGIDAPLVTDRTDTPKMSDFDKNLLAFAKKKLKKNPSLSIPDIARGVLRAGEDFLFLGKQQNGKPPKQETIEKRLRKLLKQQN